MSPIRARSSDTKTFILLQLALALVLCCPTSASAQDSTAKRDSTRLRDYWIVGPSVGMPTASGEVNPELMTVGLNFTSVIPDQLNADLSVGTMPRLLASGSITFGFRAGVTYPVPVTPNVLLLPAGGVSVIGAIGDEVAGGAIGVNAGLAAVIHGASSAGVRIGITLHQFSQANIPIFLVEVGVVHVPGLEP